MSEIQDRMAEHMQSAYVQQIMMCDDKEEILMLACAMLQRLKEMFDSRLGKDGRKLMFKEPS
jgi:hypothetical protein